MLTLSENMLALKIMIYFFHKKSLHLSIRVKLEKKLISKKTKYHQDVLISNQGERKINAKMENKNVPSEE